MLATTIPSALVPSGSSKQTILYLENSDLINGKAEDKNDSTLFELLICTFDLTYINEPLWLRVWLNMDVQGEHLTLINA